MTERELRKIRIYVNKNSDIVRYSRYALRASSLSPKMIIRKIVIGFCAYLVEYIMYQTPLQVKSYSIHVTPNLMHILLGTTCKQPSIQVAIRIDTLMKLDKSVTQIWGFVRTHAYLESFRPLDASAYLLFRCETKNKGIPSIYKVKRCIHASTHAVTISTSL